MVERSKRSRRIFSILRNEKCDMVAVLPVARINRRKPQPPIVRPQWWQKLQVEAKLTARMR